MSSATTGRSHGGRELAANMNEFQSRSFIAKRPSALSKADGCHDGDSKPSKDYAIDNPKPVSGRFGIGFGGQSQKAMS